MFCHKCGQTLPDNSVACNFCGTLFVQQVQPIPPQIQNVQPPNVSRPVIVKQSSGLAPMVFMTFVFGGLIIAGVVGFLAYKKYQDDRTWFSIGDDGIKIKAPTSSSSSTSSSSTSSQPQQTYDPPAQTSSKRYCVIQSDTRNVNLRTDCDTLDCELDDSTKAGTIAVGSRVELLVADESETTHFLWSLVKVNGGTYYIASSKLSCQ